MHNMSCLFETIEDSSKNGNVIFLTKRLKELKPSSNFSCNLYGVYKQAKQ